MDEHTFPWVVYAWGKAGDGCIGLGDETEDIEEPTALEYFRDKDIVDIAMGNKHAMAITRDGDLYSWGWNWSGQLGHGDARDRASPSLIKTLIVTKALQEKSFTSVALGSEHSLCLASDGTVYSWGGSPDGQLGNGHFDNFQAVPRQILSLSQIVEIASGASHALARAKDGSVYSWGLGSNGRLGLGDEQNVAHPTRIEMKGSNSTLCKLVGCGVSHSMLVDMQGRLWTFGKGRDGLLGLGDDKDKVVPTLVESLPPVVSIAGGSYHSLALTSPRQLFSWGWNAYGQLGHGDTETRHVPTLVQGTLGSKKITAIAAGAFQSACVSDGVAMMWGLKRYQDYMAQSEAPKQLIPEPLQALAGKNTIKVTCGYWNALALVGKLVDKKETPKSTRRSLLQQELDSFRERLDAYKYSMATFQVDLGPDVNAPTYRPSCEEQATKEEAAVDLSKQPAEESKTELARPRKASHVKMLLTQITGGPHTKEKRSRSMRKQSKGDKAMRLQQRQVENLEAAWINDILPRWEDISKVKIKYMYYQGVPPSVRGKVWLHAVGNSLRITPKLYNIFHKQAVHASKVFDPIAQKKGEQTTRRLIELDVPRTFPATNLYKKGGPLSDKLTAVLETYAAYRPDVGYVQGMSYLAGMITLYMEPYETFQTFCNLVNNHFFMSLFKMDVKQILRHVKVYELLFYKHLPTLYEHFKKLAISPEQYLLDWFLTGFSRALPLRIANRVWDNFMMEGEVFLYRTALGILKANHKQLIRTGFEDCVLMLRNLPADITEEKLFTGIEYMECPTYIANFLQDINNAAE